MLKNNLLRRRKRSFYKYSGKGKPMVSLVISNRNIVATLHDNSGKAITGVSTVGKNKSELKSNVQSASEIGKTLCAKIIAKGINAIIFNKSGFRFHGKVAKIAEELRAGGVQC